MAIKEIYKSDIATLVYDIQFSEYEDENDETLIVDNLIEFKLASQIYLFTKENEASEQVEWVFSVNSRRSLSSSFEFFF